MSDKLRSTLTLIMLTSLLIVGVVIAVILAQGTTKTPSDSSVSETTGQVTCYRCTTSNADGDSCESFIATGTNCPVGTSSTQNGCASAQTGGVCPTSGKVCYKCTDVTTDSNTCESFVHTEGTCPSGSSDSPVGCSIAAGGSCPASITCYKCTDLTNDANACQAFSYVGTTCPSGSSTLSTGCSTAVGGLCPVTTSDCGLADVNGDNAFTITDYQAFLAVYNKTCGVESPNPPSASSCGNKDFNGDGVINIVDLNQFLSQYNLPDCFVP